MRGVLDRPEDDVPLLRAGQVKTLDDDARERWAQVVATRLDAPMSALGLGQTVATSAAVQRSLAVVSWLLWAVFVGEFLLRLWVAPSRARLLRRNWWQVVFLALPVLRLVRLVLAASQLLFALEVYDAYGDALHAAALATIVEGRRPLASADVPAPEPQR